MPRETPKDGQAHDPLVDRWTPVHLLWGLVLGVLLPELWALILLVLWEPFVFLVVAPRLRGTKGALARTQLSGPTLRNVLLDLVADVLGVAAGAFLLRPVLPGLPLFGMGG